MNFLFSTVKNRLLSSKSKYALIWFQMIVGVVIFTAFLNISFYIAEEYKDMMSGKKDSSYNITAVKKDENVSVNPITTEQILYLQRTDNADFIFNFRVNIISFGGDTHINADGEEIFDSYIINYTTATDDIAASDKFLRMAENSTRDNTVNYNDLVFSISNNGISFGNDVYPIRITEDEEEYVHLIELPISFFYDYGEQISSADLSIDIKINEDDIDLISQALFNIEDYLETENENYYYTIESDFFTFLRKAWADKEQAFVFSLISVILLFMVYIGIYSLFILLIEKRSFELAISLAVGAKIRCVIFEFALEFLAISFIPSVIAIFISHLIFSDGFTFINVLIPKANIYLSVFIILSMLIIDFIVLIPIVLKLTRFKPNEFLSKY